MNFSGILQWFSSAFSRFFTDHSLYFIAKKTLYFAFLTVTVPIVLKNLVGSLFTEMADIASTALSSGTFQSAVLELTGLSAWMADKLMLQDCLAVLVTALVLKFKLSFIPFLRR